MTWSISSNEAAGGAAGTAPPLLGAVGRVGGVVTMALMVTCEATRRHDAVGENVARREERGSGSGAGGSGAAAVRGAVWAGDGGGVRAEAAQRLWGEAHLWAVAESAGSRI